MKLPMTYMPKRVSVLGAARSGCAAARFLVKKNIPVFISDSCSADKLHGILAQNGLSAVAHESGGHSSRVLDADVIVLSPGVPSDLPILLEARKKGIAIWSEIELAFRFSKSPYIAVTGSSGKSTTVSLIGSIVEAARISGVVAGNIGLPLISVAPSLSEDALVVAEVSSFQLETIDSFRPRVAVVVNFLKNHLDRYPSEDAYYDAKKNIAKNMTKEDHLALNAKDLRLREWGERLSDTTLVSYFNGDVPGHDSVWLEGAAMMGRARGHIRKIMDVSTMKIQGAHNRENACAAAAAAQAKGIGDEHIAAGVSSFSGLPHRLEFVAEVGGVRYFNDSKSTTAESIVCAVSAFSDNVYLIAGGRDKGCNFSIVKGPIARHVKGVFLIGEAADRMHGEWSGSAPIFRSADLSEALRLSAGKAAAGDVVVFSPGCSSFDMFKNYEHRGEVFKQLVRERLTKEGLQ
jgi:UDP-N-acetylmuramoylalanine--D-glutamate ligase